MKKKPGSYSGLESLKEKTREEATWKPQPLGFGER